jgi:ribosomal protein S18 acetylase RimI-like enzyme
MIKILFALSVLLRASFAIVISAPDMGKVACSPSAKGHDAQQPISLRIRSTKKSDLNGIVHILALALVDPYEQFNSVMNFRVKMDILKAKAGYSTMLHTRLEAIQTGINMADERELELREPDNLRRMWSNDAFRNKIQKAASLSSEPHIWSRHNFAYAPRCSDWLQHKMLTAEDSITGQVVGFCEVAMLSDPTACSKDDTTPTVANMAISPKYRRRGIASRLVRSASHYVRQEWCYDKLSLYVEKENDPAFFMYSNLGKRPSHLNENCLFQVVYSHHAILRFPSSN